MIKRLNAWVAAVAVFLLAGCSTLPGSSLTMSAKAAETQSLQVAMYPWVPRLDQMQSALATAWSARHPDIPLVFIPTDQWDGGYKKPIPATADIFVFDAIMLNAYLAGGALLALDPTEVQGLNDFLPYAIGPVQLAGKYYAIPLLGCTNILFYWPWDQALGSATTFSAVTNAIGQCTYTSKVPPNPNGLMVDLSGGTTNACTYIDITERLTGQWPVQEPQNPGQVYAPSIANMRTLIQMASYLNASDASDGPYIRATWFSQGQGRAVVGFTESMSAMSQATLQNVQFKVLPLSNNNAQPLFYSDLIGINALNYLPDKRALMVELANLLASTEVVVNGTGPDASGVPQYLMPARSSVFQKLGQNYPIYGRMQTLVNNANPILFTLAADAPQWLGAMKGQIQSMALQGFACGCDFSAGPIWDQQDAQNKCPGVCASHGGWNGQWVTTVPGQASDCGCNACQIQ